ncbi:hypothetical protein [Saccharothrix sp. Mg75]|uniref:hypothetical protein n=1 Tax=Saccharothrix sp. Mg75 TaxID=3445357 RepID=UPI003EE9CB96
MVARLLTLAWPQRAALTLGVLLVLWGVFDLLTGRVPLGVLHLATGALVGVGAPSTRAVRPIGALLGVVFLVVFAFGVGQDGGAVDAGFAGNAVHLLVGFAAVAVAESCAWCEQQARRAARAHKISP